MKQLPLNPMLQIRNVRNKKALVGAVLLLILLLLVVVGTATAASVAEDQTYRLDRGETIQDDLIVFAEDIIIDGTVEGDLVAFGTSIIVNGTVTEDLIAAGAEIAINGVVVDDVRVAGASIQVDGRVGDDLFATGGPAITGFGPLTIPVGDRAVVGGLGTGPSASIGGDAYFAGGFVDLEGLFQQNLFVAAGIIDLGGEVQGNANLQAETVTFGSGAFVEGNLNYASSQVNGDAEAGGVITQTAFEEEVVEVADAQSEPIRGFAWWLLRTLLAVLGIVLIGAVILNASPRVLAKPVAALGQKTVIAGLYGLLIAFALLPVGAAVVFLFVLFFGWFWGGVASFAFVFGLVLLAWVLSPLITGLWIGRTLFAWAKVRQGDVWALAAGTALLVVVIRLLGQIPCVGFIAATIVSLLSFAFAAGAIVMGSGLHVPEPEQPVNLLPEPEPEQEQVSGPEPMEDETTSSGAESDSSDEKTAPRE